MSTLQPPGASSVQTRQTSTSQPQNSLDTASLRARGQDLRCAQSMLCSSVSHEYTHYPQFGHSTVEVRYYLVFRSPDELVTLLMGSCPIQLSPNIDYTDYLVTTLLQ